MTWLLVADQACQPARWNVYARILASRQRLAAGPLSLRTPDALWRMTEPLLRRACVTPLLNISSKHRTTNCTERMLDFSRKTPFKNLKTQTLRQRRTFQLFVDRADAKEKTITNASQNVGLAISQGFANSWKLMNSPTNKGYRPMELENNL